MDEDRRQPEGAVPLQSNDDKDDDDNDDDGFVSPLKANVNFADNESVGRKYWLTGKVDKKTVTFFIDTGSDVSIIPKNLLDDRAKLKPLKRPLELSGFKDEKTTTVRERTLLHVNFAPGILRASFYVLDVPHPIIGTDLLENKDLMLSLSTGNRVFQCGVYKYNTKKSIKEAREEYFRRKTLTPDCYRSSMAHLLNSSVGFWMRAKQSTVIPPNSMALMECYVEQTKEKMKLPETHLLLSRFTADSVGDKSILIPDLIWTEKQIRYQIPVENNASTPYLFEENAVVGEIVTDLADTQCDLQDSTVEAPRGVQVYAINDVMNEIHCREREKSEKWEPSSPAASHVQSTVNNVNTGNSADDSTPVKLSRLVGVGKVPAEELQRTYRNGVSIDLEMESSLPQVNLPSPTSIDIEAEKKKAENCKY